MEADLRPSIPIARPSPQDIDIFGLSHPGKVREENQDHFLVASLHKTMQVHLTSLPDDHLGPLQSASRGYVFLVADGLGGRPSGRQASMTALRAVAEYVTQDMDLYARLQPDLEPEFIAALQRSVERGHEIVRDEGEREEGTRGMATTLTMVTVRWPRAFVIHVGDSRCYLLRDGELRQMTKDQTMAQAMIDAGVFSPHTAEESRLKHVLYSALGGSHADPDVLTADLQWDDLMLLCTDGLTKHVSDEQIQQELRNGDSAETMCRRLVDLALAGGGTDNVTVVVGRLKH